MVGGGRGGGVTGMFVYVCVCVCVRVCVCYVSVFVCNICVCVFTVSGWNQGTSPVFPYPSDKHITTSLK